MAPDVNSKPWGTQPLTTLKASPVDDHPSFNPTAGPSRGNQHGTDMRNIITDDMRFFFRDIFYKYCDEPEQPEYQRQIDNVDSDQNSDSDSDSDFLDDDDILPELIGLVLAQHRMVLSLRDAKKETDVQLRITNSRLNLVEEELTLIRTSMAEQATPSLFSGVRMGSSFGSAERDTASDYIPKFDLTDIGATLAAGPGPQSDFIQPRHLVRDGSPSPRSSNQRRRSPRPEREEHVKRTRISYDGLGGQDPKIPPSTYIFSSTSIPQSTITVSDEASTSEVVGLQYPTRSSLDTRPDPHVLPQPSLLGKLCGKMARLLLGV